MNQFKLVESIFKFMKQFRTRLDEELALAEIDFSPAFMKILKMVEKIPDCNAQKITSIFEKDKALITRIIKDMVSHELLTQNRDKKDSRVKILCLTDKGIDTLKTFRIIEDKIEKSMVSNISPDDLEIFVNVLNKIRNELS